MIGPYEMIIANSKSARFCSSKRAVLRKFLQRLYCRQLLLDVISWNISQYAEKLKYFEKSHKKAEILFKKRIVLIKVQFIISRLS